MSPKQVNAFLSDLFGDDLHAKRVLFRQGSYWFSCISNMRKEWLRPLMEAFGRILSGHAVFREVLGAV